MSSYCLHDSLGYQLSVTARLHKSRFDDMLKEMGLTRTTWCVLLAVCTEGFSRPSEIAGFIGIDRTAMSRTLRQMEAAGTIARISGTTDKRTKRVEATAQGRALLDMAIPLAKRNATLMEQNLTPEEAREMRRLLGKIRGATPLSLDRI